MKPKCEELLSNVAFNCNLRRYKVETQRGFVPVNDKMQVLDKAGRCSLTPG